MKRGCSCNVAVSEVRAVIHRKSTRKKVIFLCGFPSSCLALARRAAIPRKEPALPNFERPQRAPRSPTGAQAPINSVHAGSLRASQPRAREETRDQNRICGRCAKKMQLRIGGVTLGGVLDYSSSRRGHRCRCFPHPVRALMLVAQRARRSHNC